jgi:hypothetical protein
MISTYSWFKKTITENSSIDGSEGMILMLSIIVVQWDGMEGLP